MNTALMYFEMISEMYHHVIITNKLLLEDGYDILLEDGGIFLLEDLT